MGGSAFANNCVDCAASHHKVVIGSLSGGIGMIAFGVYLDLLRARGSTEEPLLQ